MITATDINNQFYLWNIFVSSFVHLKHWYKNAEYYIFLLTVFIVYILYIMLITNTDLIWLYVWWWLCCSEFLLYAAFIAAHTGVNNHISVWQQRRCPSLICIVFEAGKFQAESGSSLLQVWCLVFNQSPGLFFPPTGLLHKELKKDRETRRGARRSSWGMYECLIWAWWSWYQHKETGLGSVYQLSESLDTNTNVQHHWNASDSLAS